MWFRELATFVIAIYGAIVSTIALRSNIKKERQNVGKLTLCASIACVEPAIEGARTTTSFILAQSSIPLLPEGDRQFVIRCTNIGTRPLTLVNWALISRSQDGGVFRAATTFVHRLEESESASFIISDFNKLRSKVTGLCVEDTHGRYWNLPDTEFIKMKEVMLEYRL